MSRYITIRTDMWTDRAVEDMSAAGKLLYIYLLSAPASNAAGFYRISPKQIALDTGLGVDTVETMLNAERKLWIYDDATRQVLIPTFLKHNRAISKTQLAGLNTQIMGLEFCRLHVDFFYEVMRYNGAEAVLMFDGALLRYIKVKCMEHPQGIKEAALISILNS